MILPDFAVLAEGLYLEGLAIDRSEPTDGGDTLKEGGEISAGYSFLHKARSAVPGRRIEPVHFRIN